MNRCIFIFGSICCFTLIGGQINKPDSRAYCFNFTWLGPSYSNSSSVNFACPESEKIPCIQPFVVTTNSQVPNTTSMWEKRDEYNISIICPLVSGTCIKYSYIYDNTVLNTTYFCGKMTEDQTNPVTTGCYTHTVNGYTIEACACKSFGDGPPCNSSPSTYLPSPFIFLIMIFTIYQAL
ncbi:uncharacterized protein [Chelonus insularis]|uniref:uncharacterized protein n=1 Tax=Chelonus insularis TaxID=460826 RepID=UPI00158EF469|nr:uncharacterized protein LOC118066156 [Chelonus insularis]